MCINHPRACALPCGSLSMCYMSSLTGPQLNSLRSLCSLTTTSFAISYHLFTPAIPFRTARRPAEQKSSRRFTRRSAQTDAKRKEFFRQAFLGRLATRANDDETPFLLQKPHDLSHSPFHSYPEQK